MLTQLLRFAGSVALLALVATPTTAQPADKRTSFKFSGPVAMPGVTLPAGEYLFRLANPDSGRNVVQVLSADGSQAYGMFFSLRADRLEPAPTPEVRFMETAAGVPPAIRTWWYPGERSGYEFVYPKEQARRLAQGTSQPVLTTQAQTTTTAQTNTADLGRVSSTGQETSVNADAAQGASTPAGSSQTGEIASAALTIPNVTIPARPDAGIAAPERREAPVQTARAELPQTASATPIALMVGAIALGAGLGARAYRHRRI
jgi:hypothetical protein